MSRPFGAIIYDIAAKYDRRISPSDLCKLEKILKKTRKSELDLAFLRNCKSPNVYPKFLCFHLPSNTARQDVLPIKKHLLKSAINRRFKEHRKLLCKRNNLMTRISSILNSLDSYILCKAVAHSLAKAANQFIKTHEKKLKNLTRNSVLPFTSREVVTNLSSFVLTAEQLDALKFGLTHSICPPSINKTDIFTCFELISQRMTRNLKDSKDTGKLVAELSHLAHTYVSAYRPTTTELKKHGFLKKLTKEQGHCNFATRQRKRRSSFR